MNELLPIFAATMLALWLIAMAATGSLARARQAECSTLGVSTSSFVSAYRIRVTLNMVVILLVVAVCISVAPIVNIDPLVGMFVGSLIAIPTAYLALALANKLVWLGFNDIFVSVRRLARQRRERRK